MNDQMLTSVALKFKILSDSTRLKILTLLMDGEKAVSDIVEKIDSSQPNVSKHLTLLEQHDFVSKRKEGVFVIYAIATPVVHDLCKLMCQNIDSQAKEKYQQLKKSKP